MSLALMSGSDPAVQQARAATKRAKNALKPEQVWLVHGDGGEFGDGPVIGWATSNALANIASEGKAWWGGKGVVKSAMAVVIDGSLFVKVPKAVFMDNTKEVAKLLKKKADEALRRKVLLKLTPDEAAVLGVKK